LWRRPVAFACFATDILTPFALYAVAGLAVAHGIRGHGGATGLPLALELPLGYLGMLTSIGVRQAAHVRRSPRDLVRLPIFVLQITFVMVPIRIAAFATMFHQGWSSRGDRPARSRVRLSLLPTEPTRETVSAMPGESTP
jgi:hypothetical protein